MKKFICIVSAILCLLTGVLPCCAATDIIFTLGAAQPQGKNITLSISVSKDSALYTSEFFILYDPDCAEFVEGSEEAGEQLDSLKPYITATQVQNGKIKVSYTATEPLDISAVLCVLQFRAKADCSLRFDVDVDHAETFDGKHIRSLTTAAQGTQIAAAKQSALPAGTAAALIGAVSAAVIAVVLVVRKRSKH